MIVRHVVAAGILAMWLHAHVQDMHNLFRTPISFLLACPCVLLHVHHLYSSESTSNWLSSAERMCFSYDDIILRSERVRLFMYHFIHADDLHLTYNVITLMSVGARIETSLGLQYYVTLIIATFLLHPIAMLLLARWCRRRDYIPDILLRDRVVGFSGVLFAMMVIEQEMLSSGTTWVGLPGFGTFVNRRLAPIVQLVFFQFLAPNVSLVGHLCGMLSGYIFLLSFRVWDQYGLYFSDNIELILTGSAWFVVAVAAAFWFHRVALHQPQYSSHGKVGKKSSKAVAVDTAHEEIANVEASSDVAIYSDSNEETDTMGLEVAIPNSLSFDEEARMGRVEKFITKPAELAAAARKKQLGFMEPPPRFNGGGMLGGHDMRVMNGRLARFGGKTTNRPIDDPGAPTEVTTKEKRRLRTIAGTGPSTREPAERRNAVSVTQMRADRVSKFDRISKFDQRACLILKSPEQIRRSTALWKAPQVKTVEDSDSDSFLIGEHCHCDDCHQLEFSPLFCEWCGYPFCQRHHDDHCCQSQKNQIRNERLLRRLLLMSGVPGQHS